MDFSTRQTRRRSYHQYLPMIIAVVCPHKSQSFLMTKPMHRQPTRPLLNPFSASYRDTQKTVSSTPASSALMMCQLLGMNCAQEVELAIAWDDFCARGGGTDIHGDGWGLAYYEGNGLRQFHDVQPAATSALAKFVGEQQIQTSNMLAHIRYCTSGDVSISNAHPFVRETWGLNWCFCHNGQVPLFEERPAATLGGLTAQNDRFYVPVGKTDSEATFCAILNTLRSQFTDGMPSLPVLYQALANISQEIVDYDPEGTILNYLLACGPHTQWAYSWPGQRPGSKVWNGLHYTVRSGSKCMCYSDFAVDTLGTTDDLLKNPVCCVVATKPLTDDEEWIELERGELILLDGGRPQRSMEEIFTGEQSNLVDLILRHDNSMLPRDVVPLRLSAIMA